MNIDFSFIKPNISLADKNWFKTGGSAKFFATPKNAQEFQQSILFAKTNNLQIFLLGEGANILISDDGFDGLIIKPDSHNIEIIDYDNEHNLIKVDAGISFNYLIQWCLNKNLSGLEEFSGIPGTIGGSVFINIHYYEFLLSHFLINAEVIEKKTGKILTVDLEWFNFGYNYSRLHLHEHYLLSATFKLKKINELEKAYCLGRRAEIIRHRLKRYPNTGTCGSFFRNFFENEISCSIQGKKIIYVAYYLDKIGVKGALNVGNACVSYQHANMLINLGNATTQNIIDLAKKMQELVYNHFGILPQPECRLIGFAEYPLLK